MAWKPFKKLRDYLPENRQKEYDDINSGNAIGGLDYTLEFLNLVPEAKKVLKEIWENTKFEDSRKRIAIEVVLKVLEEYEKQLDLDYVRENYISKDKVKKKIEELELLKKALPIRTEIPRFIDLLKELLGE